MIIIVTIVKCFKERIITWSLHAAPQVVGCHQIMVLWGGVKVFEVIGKRIVGGIAVVLVIVVVRLIYQVIKLFLVEEFTMVNTIIEFIIQSLRPETR